MALMLIKKSTLPVSPRGKTGSLSVAVRENGQVGFSNSAGKAFDNHTHCMISWDPETRAMAFTPANDKKLPKGVTAEELFVVGQSKDGQRYISAAGLFKMDGIDYDYKTAGTHSFPATVDKGTVNFTLPASMTPKPKQPRQKKDKTSAAGAGANATGATSDAPADGEPVLEQA